MSKTQAANVIGRLPIVPFVGKNMSVRAETKMEPGKSKPVTTTVTMATTAVQMSALGATTLAEQGRTTETQATPKTLPVVKLDTIPKEEVNVEKDAQASGKTREAGMETGELGTRPEKME